MLILVSVLICEIGPQKRRITFTMKQSKVSKEVDKKTSKEARRGAGEGGRSNGISNLTPLFDN